MAKRKTITAGETTGFSASHEAPAGSIYIGQSGKAEFIYLRLANRHGLVTGATGTGKTVTLQVLAEGFSDAGVPVFCADIKGDLSGIADDGRAEGLPASKRARGRSASTTTTSRQFPVIFWDLFGEQGHPVRATDLRDGAAAARRACWISTTRRKACSTSPSRSPTTKACCCST